MAKVDTPNLNFIARNGIKAKHLLNTFVTKTFPNHFTSVTELHEESNGIVANMFFDPVFRCRVKVLLGFKMVERRTGLDHESKSF